MPKKAARSRVAACILSRLMVGIGLGLSERLVMKSEVDAADYTKARHQTGRHCIASATRMISAH